MAIDLPIMDPVRLSSTNSTDIYEAPSSPSSTKVVGLSFSFHHDGTSTDAVAIAVHHVSTNGTYGSDTQVDRVVVSQNKREVSKLFGLGPGGKIICAADAADQITVDMDSGVIFS